MALGLAAALPLPAPAAADGELDRSFSRDGRVVTDVQAGSKDRPATAAVDAAGRLLIAGTSIRKPEGGRFAVARYLPGGSLDPGFGAGGIVVSDAEGGMSPVDMALDSAGRIVLAGHHRRGLAVARLLPDGRLDPGFAGDGVLSIALELDPHAVAVDAFDRVVFAGALRTRGRRGGIAFDSAVGRLRPDGSSDTSLAGTGLVSFDLASGGPDHVADLLIDRLGRIVAAGGAWLPTPGASRNVGSFALARLHPDGRLDDSLRDAGGARMAVNERGAHATAVALTRAGNLLLAGNAPPRAGFVALRDGGRLLRRFGRRGRAKLAVRGELEPVGLALDRAGRPVAALGAGRVFAPGAGDLIAARLRANGAPDRGFSRDGRVSTGFGRWAATATDVALYPSGEIALVGVAKRGGSDRTDFAAARYR